MIAKVEQDDKRVHYIPLDAISVPKDGHEVYVNRWWVVHPSKGAVIWVHNKGRFWSPQCNTDERVTRMLVGMYPWAKVQQLPVAYLPIRYTRD